jgi:deazaflavin-dependent oxidoreductase (nitroreductase family)
MSGRAALALAVLLALTPPARAGVPVSQLRSYEDASTLELTTTGRKSGEPRTVTIWFVVDERGQLYVQSGKSGTTDWYRNLLETPAVTIRIGELGMKGVAAPVDDLTEVARVHELFRQKYLRARIAEWIGSETGHGRVVQLGELNQLP